MRIFCQNPGSVLERHHPDHAAGYYLLARFGDHGGGHGRSIADHDRGGHHGGDCHGVHVGTVGELRRAASYRQDVGAKFPAAHWLYPDRGRFPPAHFEGLYLLCNGLRRFCGNAQSEIAPGVGATGQSP